MGYHDSIVTGGSNAHDGRNEVSVSCRHMLPTVARFSPPPAVSPGSFQQGYEDASRIQSEAATSKPFGNNLRFQTAIVGTALRHIAVERARAVRLAKTGFQARA